jgi:hypothetical protein
MLSEQERQLLSGYLDRELTRSEHRQATELLKLSPEAKALFQKLRQDSSRLQRLPQHSPDPDFIQGLLQAIGEQPSPIIKELDEYPATIPLWKGYAAAGALLLAVATSSFIFFARPLNTSPPVNVSVHNRGSPSSRVPDVKASKEGLPPLKGQDAKNSLPLVAQGNQPEILPILPNPLVLENPRTPGKPDNSLSDPPKPSTGLTAPVEARELFKPAIAPVPLLSLVDVREIQAEKIVKDVQKGESFRIELPCPNTSQGFKRFQTVVKEAGINLLIDPVAKGWLDKPRLKANFIVFLEGLSPNELGQILARLGREEKKTALAHSPSQAQFTKLVLNRMTEADHEEFSNLLGKDSHPLGPKSRVGVTKPGVSKPDRLGLVVTYHPNRSRPGSPEVKRFFENRPLHKTGTIQVLVVLRGMPK